MSSSSDDVQTKTFEGYLIVNWKNETMRHRKTESDDLAPTQQAISVNINVKVPEVTVPTIEATIEVLCGAG